MKVIKNLVWILRGTNLSRSSETRSTEQLRTAFAASASSILASSLTHLSSLHYERSSETTVCFEVKTEYGAYEAPESECGRRLGIPKTSE